MVPHVACGCYDAVTKYLPETTERKKGIFGSQFRRCVSQVSLKDWNRYNEYTLKGMYYRILAGQSSNGGEIGSWLL